MEHSLRSYLQRQSTTLLQLLLRDYGEQSEKENTELVNMIHEILAQRIEKSEEPPLL